MKSDWKNDHCSLQVIDNPAIGLGRVREVVRVWTDPEHRNQGYATDLLNQVFEEADTLQFVLVLQPKEFGKSNGLKDLRKFYEKFGFIKIQDKPVLMARAPTFNPERKPMIQALEAMRAS